MSPTLKDGDYILTKKIKPRFLQPGLIYVVNHSDLGRIVKRLKSIENELCVFEGDTQKSTPSSVIAPVSKERVTHRALLTITKYGLKKL